MEGSRHRHRTEPLWVGRRKSSRLPDRYLGICVHPGASAANCLEEFGVGMGSCVFTHICQHSFAHTRTLTGDPNSPPECPGGGFPFGNDSLRTVFPDVVTTPWVRGSVVPVAWGIKSNHGGGYIYRLCRMPPEGPAGLTEDCFQRTPLRFVGDDQYVQYGNDTTQRVYFKVFFCPNRFYFKG